MVTEHISTNGTNLWLFKISFLFILARWAKMNIKLTDLNKSQICPMCCKFGQNVGKTDIAERNIFLECISTCLWFKRVSCKWEDSLSLNLKWLHVRCVSLSYIHWFQSIYKLHSHLFLIPLIDTQDLGVSRSLQNFVPCRGS